MKFRDEDIEKLNSALKIEEVVGKFVSLKKSGANYKGLCPFHDDTSPSFMVSPTKNICKCFVCGAGGGPIKFYSDYKKLTFSQSVKELSETYNMPIKILNETKEERLEYLRYYEIMKLSNEYYCNQIFENSGRVAMEYLNNRGLTAELIKKHSVGYSPNNYNGLTEYLISKGYSTTELVITGMSKENEKGIYDSFRHRIMFPIYSIDNKVIAFGGRTLETDKDVPKYINSSDTPIFKKGNILYGLGEKHQVIKKKNYSMLMEGYMDVLMSTIHGFDVTLAPLGTALTEEQAKLLKRYTNNVILSFDMDAPGQKATEKAIMILKEESFSI
ncbi:MAG: DNA primase, partial [Fusobacteriaceae bacterium]